MASLTAPRRRPDRLGRGDRPRARIALIDESFFALGAGEVIARGAQAAPRTIESSSSGSPAGYSPAADRPVWRLSGELSPSFPAPACRADAGTTNAERGRAAATRAAPGPRGSRRAERSMRRHSSSSPRAQAAGQARRAGARKGAERRGRRACRNHAEFERGRLAMLGLIQIARGDDDGALKTIRAIEPPLKKLGANAPVHTRRWPGACWSPRGRSSGLRPVRSGRRAPGHHARANPQASAGERSLPNFHHNLGSGAHA